MTWLARSAALAVLATALCLGMPVSAISASGPSAKLDPARVFSRDAELLFALARPVRSSPIVGAALFNVVVPDTLSVAAEPVPPVVARVNLVAPVQHLAGATLAAPAVTVPIYGNDAPLIAPSIDVPVARDIGAMAVSTRDGQAVRFGSYQPYVPSLAAVTADVSVPVRIGPLHFTEQLESSGMQTLHPDAFRALQVCGTTDQAAPCPYLADSQAQSFAAATNFTVRAGNDSLALQLSGSIERLANGPGVVFPYVPLDSDPLLLSSPGLNDVVKRGLSAKLAVPVTPRVTVGLQFESQHYQGDYGALLFPGLDAHRDTYLGNVTYQLPNSSSMITFSARHYRYQDTFLPDLTQTRADVDFTVKF